MDISDLNLLVADDHGFQRRHLVRLLRDLGANSIHEAGNGRAALDCLDGSGDIDVVLCDLDMPEMDGMEFIRNLHQRAPGASLIVTSALDAAVIDSVATMSHAYGVTVLGSIAKPVTVGRLAELLARFSRDQRPEARAAHACDPEEVRAALARGEFEPFFQPKAELQSGQIYGAEALARWCRRGGNVMPPADFLEVIESAGLMRDLTWTMLKKSAVACRAWRAAGHALTVAVNISQTLLDDPGLAARITDLVRGAGLDPSHMVLEITESATMSHLGSGLENLTRLRMHGFGLSIDDYGTGSSTLQQLMRVPFTELKIDRSFVSGIDTQDKLRVMVEASMAMAGGLRLKFVAEGVETPEEWATLKKLGCFAVQGYLVSKPLADADFLPWMAAWIPPA